MKKIVYAGSFDPLTKGHWWVIQEALHLANEVEVFIAHNPSKKTGMFTPQERKEMIEAVAKSHGVEDRVYVTLVQNEYVAVKSKQIGADYMIRGIRNSNDFDQEATLQRANSEVLLGAKTLFVMPPRELDGVSSSFVKGMVGPIGWHYHIKKFLPEPVYKLWLKKYIKETVKNFVLEPEKYNELNKFIDYAIKAYDDESRHYHNLEHITHCLQELQNLSLNTEAANLDFEALSLAIVAHDMVYDKEGEDELKSAKLMMKMLGESESTTKIYDIVMATEHATTKGKFSFEEQQVMKSLDLAVLAQPSFAYIEYCNSIRKEYLKYSEKDYKNGRLKILQMFLNLPKIYESKYFYAYEDEARANIKNEILELL